VVSRAGAEGVFRGGSNRAFGAVRLADVTCGGTLQAMTMTGDSTTDAGPGLPGFAVTGVTPDDQTAVAAAMLIAMLAHDGANVAAMVPVETGLDEPCEPGSRGALIRWAAGHLDDPRQVTPFALEADRSAMHAADASGTLLHGAAFNRARAELSDGRSVLVVMDAVGVLDPITPSLTMLDLIERWQLSVIVVEPVSRWAVGHVRMMNSLLVSREIFVSGVILSLSGATPEIPVDEVEAIRDTIAAILDRPVLLLPRVRSAHDRGELLTAAAGCGLHRLAARHSS
jgi:dethiobiotin synthetase